MTSRRVLVQATINLQGLRAGEYAWVDPADPWMRQALEHTWIVPVDAGYEPAAQPGSLAADGGQIPESPRRQAP